jgi:Holliday junction DNA helicase RuvA
MIALLSGRLLDKAPSRIVIDVHGVGYDVQIPLSTFYGLGEAGTEVSLRVHTHVREEALTLFGFGTRLELKVFEQLIGISGIGPRLALSVLSGIESVDLVRAVREGDVGRLTGIPGVGKKTAERIGLELKDRLQAVLEANTDHPADSVVGSDTRGDLLSALLNLGYHRHLAERAVDAALAETDGTFEQILRQALKELAR